MLGDLQRAIYYHNRSIEFIYECDNSASKLKNDFLKQSESIKEQMKEKNRNQDID